MAVITTHAVRGSGYPTSDGRAMAETDLHYHVIVASRDRPQHHFAADPMIYVSDNVLVCYEQGNKRKHVAPDVFAVRGVPNHPRDNYHVWEEGKGPEAVLEITSKTTRKEDTGKKLTIYRDILHVAEYFLF